MAGLDPWKIQRHWIQHPPFSQSLRPFSQIRREFYEESGNASPRRKRGLRSPADTHCKVPPSEHSIMRGTAQQTRIRCPHPQRSNERPSTRVFPPSRQVGRRLLRFVLRVWVERRDLICGPATLCLSG